MSVLQDAPGTPGTQATGTAGVGQGDTSAQCQTGQCYQICTPKPVPVPSPEAEAHLQEPGFCVGHRNPQIP